MNPILSLSHSPVWILGQHVMAGTLGTVLFLPGQCVLFSAC